MAEHIIDILSLSDRSIIPVFRHQGLLRNSDGFTPNGSAEYKGIPLAIFEICGYILETIIGRVIGYLLWKTNKFVCALSNSAAFDDPE